MKQFTPTVIAVIFIAGTAMFFGGIKYENYRLSKNRNTIFRQFQGPGNTPNGMRNNRGMGNKPVAGEILSIDEKSMTVKLPDGSSKIVLMSEKTTLNKASEATKEDLKIGERVNAFGTDNPDGSVTALNIQINPLMRNN